MNRKNKKRWINIGVLILVLAGLLGSLFSPISASANSSPPSQLTEQVVLQFSTSVIKSSSKNNGVLDSLQIVLNYHVYPQSNGPIGYPVKSVIIDNTKSRTFNDSLSITITRPDETIYSGVFNYTVFYDTKTSELKVNNTNVSIGTRNLLDATVYPEAFVEGGVVAVDMNPLPFSQVKAVGGRSASWVDTFNNRVNGSINQTITLNTNLYGSNISSTTKLALYIMEWQRRPDGTYDTTKDKVRLQVIYTAADFLNGRAASDGWDGVQRYRQLVAASTYKATQYSIQAVVGTQNVTYYNVQNRIGNTYSWGFNGVVGAVSSIVTGTCTNSQTTNCVQNYYQFTRYEIRCSNYWRTSFNTRWSATNITTASGGGDTFCRNNFSSQPYFREQTKSETTAWLTHSTLSGYTRTRTGYTYQTSIAVPNWGPTYTTTTRPTATELSSGGKRIMNQWTRTENVLGTVTMVKLANDTIARADNLTETGVNSRVTTFAQGLAAKQLLSSGDMLLSVYGNVFYSTEQTKTTEANNVFKEGNYWGLYLYQTSHWRAVQVPISWYSISANTNRPTTLNLTYTPPPPPPETDISLADFGYVQSVYNAVRTENSQRTLAQIQTAFMTRLRADNNDAAKKTVLYYDALIAEGLTAGRAYERISKDFNINLISK